MDLDPRRSLEEFADAFASLLPYGIAWPRENDSTLMRLATGLAGVWAGPVQDTARRLLYVEAFPDTTGSMLPDWERVAGLPEECYETVAQTVEARRAILVAKLTSEGGQTPAYFVGLARDLGHPEARIAEFSPFRAGRSHCGSRLNRTGSPEQRYVWRLHIGPSAVSWFRTGKSRCGAGGQAKIRRSSAVECIVNRLKPGHTSVVFTYSFPAPTFPKDVAWFRTGRGKAGRDPQADVTAWGDFVEPAPAEVEWFRAGRNRIGRDPHARRVTVVAH